MSCSTLKQLVLIMLSLAIALTAWASPARSPLILSRIFQVCVHQLPGVTATTRIGIDAIDGKIIGQGGHIQFYIGGYPRLPEAMHIKQQKGGYILPPLTADPLFIAASFGPFPLGALRQSTGYGPARLYAFKKGMVDTPAGPLEDRVYVQLWSYGANGRNEHLLKTVGDALYRCR